MSLAIQAISAVIPGLKSNAHGSLVPTNHLFKMIGGSKNESMGPNFLEEKMGFSSISFTHSSLKVCEQIWSKGLSEKEAFVLSQTTPNLELYEMLRESIQKTVTKAAIPLEEYVFHIHISAITNPNSALWIKDILHDLGFHRGIDSITLPQGCSGLLSALKLSRAVLDQQGGHGSVLITADSDMMVHSSQRALTEKNKENIDSWLWGAIFGEGVGSMVVGYDDKKNSTQKSWSVDGFFEEVVQNEWRVAPRWKKEKGISQVLIRAKEVKKTYLKNVTKHASKVIEAAGGTDKLDYLCLHESNPKIVRLVSRNLGVDDSKVPLFSNKVGTLACVSIFKLLDFVINETEKHEKIGVAVIGEAGGNVRAGRFAMNQNSGKIHIPASQIISQEVINSAWKNGIIYADSPN